MQPQYQSSGLNFYELAVIINNEGGLTDQYALDARSLTAIFQWIGVIITAGDRARDTELLTSQLKEIDPQKPGKTIEEFVKPDAVKLDESVVVAVVGALGASFDGAGKLHLRSYSDAGIGKSMPEIAMLRAPLMRKVARRLLAIEPSRNVMPTQRNRDQLLDLSRE